MSPVDRELESLVDGCRKGDRKRQQQVYERYYGKMMGLCMRYARDHAEAQDLLQEGFIKVFTKIEKYNRQGSFEGWIRRIIVNNAIDSFRRKKNDFVLTDSDYVLDLHHEPPEDEDTESRYGNIKADDIVAAIQKLSPAYRNVFNLYVVENYSHKEISEMLGISVGTSKSNLAKAKRNLRKILEKKYIR